MTVSEIRGSFYFRGYNFFVGVRRADTPAPAGIDNGRIVELYISVNDIPVFMYDGEWLLAAGGELFNKVKNLVIFTYS